MFSSCLGAHHREGQFMTQTASIAATPRLDKDGAVAVLNLGAGENRFHVDSVAEILALLDEVEAGDFTALVTTAEGKIWSNGYDTAWAAQNPELCAASIEAGERLFARVLAFPIPTVAALQGHAFAAGMILALAHDTRIMRQDRGFLCLPEVSFGAVFSEGMTALLAARMTSPTAHRAMVLGHRFPATEAVAAGLVEEALPLEQLQPRAVEVARNLGGHDRGAVVALKEQIYREPLRLLGSDAPPGLVEALLALGRSG